MSVLTLSMIVKNEEKFLRGCLESVKKITDEIVIVETGSTDKTLEIANEFGAKIYHFQWINDFSAARNYALSKSEGDWILYLDADERITPESVPEILSIIQTNKRAAVFCKIDSKIKNIEETNIIKYSRLFKNEKGINFEGKIHEQILPSLRRLGYESINSGITIQHLGYDLNTEEIHKKAERNLKYLLEELKENYTEYNVFKTAQTYDSLGDKDKANNYFNEVLNFDDCIPIFKAFSYYYIAKSFFEENNFNAALEIITKALLLDETLSYVHYLSAWCNYKLGDYEQAQNSCVKSHVCNLYNVNDFFDLKIPQRDILVLGLNSSISSLNRKAYNYFYEELLKFPQKNSQEDFHFKTIYTIINQLEFDGTDICDLSVLSEKTSVLPLIKIISEYKILDDRLLLLERMRRVYPQIDYLEEVYAKSLNEAGDFNACSKILEQLLLKNNISPSIYFYLVSAYVMNKELQKAFNLLGKAEQLFDNSPDILAKIKSIRQKISINC